MDLSSLIDRCSPLVPGLRFRSEIIGIDAVRCILPWKTPHYIAVFTEDAPLALAHLRLSHPETFRFFTVPQPPTHRGCAYIGSVRL